MARFVSVVRPNVVSGQSVSPQNRTTVISGFSTSSGVPSGNYGVIIGLLGANKTNNTVQINYQILKSGTTSTGDLLHQVQIPAFTTLEAIEGDKIILEAGDTLQCYSNTTNAVDVTASYMINRQDETI